MRHMELRLILLDVNFCLKIINTTKSSLNNNNWLYVAIKTALIFFGNKINYVDFAKILVSINYKNFV